MGVDCVYLEWKYCAYQGRLYFIFNFIGEFVNEFAFVYWLKTFMRLSEAANNEFGYNEHLITTE